MTDAIRPIDLPVMSKARTATVRRLDVVDRDPQMEDQTVEAVALWRRLQVVVVDFYRFRPEGA